MDVLLKNQELMKGEAEQINGLWRDGPSGVLFPSSSKNSSDIPGQVRKFDETAIPQDELPYRNCFG